jgi:hypothetical protein
MRVGDRQSYLFTLSADRACPRSASKSHFAPNGDRLRSPLRPRAHQTPKRKNPRRIVRAPGVLCN